MRRGSSKPDPAWRRYEVAAQEILQRLCNELGLSKVEGKQTILGDSGATWEIDAKGIVQRDTAFVIIECRRYTTSKIKQEEAAALAWRVQDTGATGALLVSPLGLQEGAAKVAASSRILAVHMTPDSTLEEFVVSFLDKLFVSLRGVEARSGIGALTPIIEDNVNPRDHAG